MLFRKMIRTALKYKAQFISMIIMIAIGVGMFLGFNIEWVSLDVDTSGFLAATNFADYRIVSQKGFTERDAKKLEAVEGIDRVSRYLSVDTDVDGTRNMLALTVTENPEVSSFLVMEGEPYDPESENGIWLFDHYAEANDIKLGDDLSLTYEELHIQGKVKGLIEAGEYLISVREDQIMPDFTTYGYAYISPVMFEAAFMDAAKNSALSYFDESVPADFADFFASAIGKVTGRETFETVYPQINVISGLSKKEFRNAADETFRKTLLILTKEETVSYSESQGEIEEGKTMGSILPVLFLLIAVLTMVTTMNRLTTNEKTQIGILKALGFKDGKILWHYTTYALAIGILGTALGIALGYLVARIILAPDGMMGTYIVMPDWTLHLPWWCWLVMAVIVGFLTLIGVLSTKNMLKGTAADALRPYTPKNIRRMAIERIKAVAGLGFGTKWNLRDILRHKARSFMTLFGILGCTLLIAAALGMSDTVNVFLDSYYNDIANYSSKVLITDSATNSDALKLAGEVNGDSCASISVELKDEVVSLDIYHIEHDTLRFLDEDNERETLPDDGAFVCLRLQEAQGLAVGDEITVSPFGTSETYTIRIAGFNRSLSESISLSDTYAEKLTSDGIPITKSDVYKINSVYTQLEKSNISGEAVSSIQSIGDIIASMDSFMEIMNTMILVLIVAAVVLGIIVLYNLGIMSFTERYREMATLKVVGFKDKQIGRLLISQNTWLSVIGIVIGIPVGYAILVILMKMLASEYEMKAVLSVASVAISVVLTLGVSLIVGYIIARKNRKIEMVAALKAPE